MSEKNTYNQSFWYFKPEALMPFGMHKGKRVLDVLQADFNYLNYCLLKLDHFMFSRPILRYLQRNTTSHFSADALETLGQKMDKSDAFMASRITRDYKNYSRTGSVIKNVHAKGVHDIMDYESLFKFIEYREVEKIHESNYQWFSKFFENLLKDHDSDKSVVRCTMFLINHGFKAVWARWMKENWWGNRDVDLCTYCINVLEEGIDVALIIVVDTRHSLYSEKTTRQATDFESKTRELKPFPARNEYLLPYVDFWRYYLRHEDDGKKNNWSIKLLHNTATKRHGSETYIDGKSTTSKILARKSAAYFYIEDADFTAAVAHYYSKVINSDFLEKRRLLQEKACDEDQFGSVPPDDDTNHDEDAWDALTDGQYGDYDDRFD